jgi:hypothetical protein
VAKRLSDEERDKVAREYVRGEHLDTLAEKYGISTQTVRRIVKDKGAVQIVVPSGRISTNIREFLKRARSVLWRQEKGPGREKKKTYAAWTDQVKRYEESGRYTKQQAVVRASKNFPCLAKLMRDFDLSRYDTGDPPDMDGRPRNKDQVEPGIVDLGVEQSHRDNLNWAIEEAGRFFRTKVEPRECPNNASYYLFRQACEDPTNFMQRFNQIEGKGTEDAEERSRTRSANRSIEELTRMLHEIESADCQ